mmetsp:Transcript_18529/g.47635  ORF Transcript_18529/g.47635 Transcript_18529/m.47635 type:complete len:246 (+) Transcript_18529:2354-3091(+)
MQVLPVWGLPSAGRRTAVWQQGAGLQREPCRGLPARGGQVAARLGGVCSDVLGCGAVGPAHGGHRVGPVPGPDLPVAVEHRGALLRNGRVRGCGASRAHDRVRVQQRGPAARGSGGPRRRHAACGGGRRHGGHARAHGRLPEQPADAAVSRHPGAAWRRVPAAHGPRALQRPALPARGRLRCKLRPDVAPGRREPRPLRLRQRLLSRGRAPAPVARRPARRRRAAGGHRTAHALPLGRRRWAARA